MNSSLVREIFRGLELTEAQTELISPYFKRLLVKKGQLILSADQFVPYQYFVFSGCLRSYYLDQSGKEHTMQFAMKDWWISDYTAFFTGGRSILYIDCINDAEIFQISKESMAQLYRQLQSIETYFRLKMERFFVSSQKRVLSDLSLSATERYKGFVATYPQMNKYIKNYHLASYLGITTESLSRIRKDLAGDRNSTMDEKYPDSI